MNVETSVARYLRDLIEFPEADIKFAKDNENIDNFKNEFIVIYSLNEQINTTSKRFINNQIEIATNFVSAMSISFYGDNALTTAQLFISRIRTEESLILQYEYGIAVYLPNAITNVNILVGDTYNNRYDIDLNIRFTVKYLTPTEFIEGTELQIYTEDKIIIKEIIGEI